MHAVSCSAMHSSTFRNDGIKATQSADEGMYEQSQISAEPVKSCLGVSSAEQMRDPRLNAAKQVSLSLVVARMSIANSSTADERATLWFMYGRRL